MATFGYAEMRDWAEQSDDPRVRSMWERLSNCRSKIAKWCQAAEYAELRTKNLVAENAALRAEVERLREELDEVAHVVLEHAVDFPHRAICRCDACRHVAQRLDDAGFCDHAKDRWWQPLPAPPDAG